MRISVGDETTTDCKRGKWRENNNHEALSTFSRLLFDRLSGCAFRGSVVRCVVRLLLVFHKYGDSFSPSFVRFLVCSSGFALAWGFAVRFG